jgi:hypothetical protein
VEAPGSSQANCCKFLANPGVAFALADTSNSGTGCPSSEGLELLIGRVMYGPLVDEFVNSSPDIRDVAFLSFLFLNDQMPRICAWVYDV